MEVITKKYEVFSYDELSDKAKEKIQNYFGQNDVEFQTDMLREEFPYKLEEDHPYFVNPKFSWSLSCCQGDGLSFSCDIDLNKYLNIYHKNMKKSVYNALCEVVYGLKSNGNTGRYCYASKNDIYYELNYRDGIERKHLYQLLEDIVEEIRQKYLEVCQEFKQYGYSAYEFLYSDEYAKNTCEANDYKFLANGEFFN